MTDRPLPPHAFDRLLDAGRPRADVPIDCAGPTSFGPVGKYELLREVGQGGMGVVYEARDTELGRRVALKLLRERLTSSPDAWERFQREARTVARLSHPNIAAIHEARDRYIAMQFIDGETLATVPRDDVRALVAWIRDAARAVHHAHERGVIHRDIKPHNLMVDGQAQLFVMDFGLAKRTAVESSLSTSGHILGTPSYMAPEQARGDVRQVDARTDVYALGATLYELVTHHPPFSGSEVYEILRQVVEDEPASPRKSRPALDVDIETIVLKCLEKDSARRYAGADALADDLDRWLENRPIEARPPSRLYRMRKFVARRRAVVTASAIGVVGIAIVLTVLLPILSRETRGRSAANRALELWGSLSNLVADAELYRRVGDIDESNDRLNAGIATCEAFLAEEPLADAYYFLGRLHHAKGEHALARAALDKALARNPDLGEARYQRGIVFVEMYGSRLSMDRELFAAVRDDPRPPMYDVARLEGMFPHARMMHDLAEIDLSVEVGQSSYFRAVDAIYGKAELARIRGDRELALDSLDRVIESEPLYVPAWVSRGAIALGDGRWHDAVRDASAAIDRHRGASTAYITRAVARLWLSDDIDEVDDRTETVRLALADAERAVALGDPTAEARLALGNCHFELGDLDAAVAAYDDAIRIDNRRAHAFANRGLSRLLLARAHAGTGNREKQEHLDAAVEDLREATLINHQLPAPYLRLAEACMLRGDELDLLGDHARALDSFRMADEALERAQAQWTTPGAFHDDVVRLRAEGRRRLDSSR